MARPVDTITIATQSAPSANKIHTVRRSGAAVAAILHLLAIAGCVGVSARESWLKNTIASHQEQHRILGTLSDVTGQVLQHHGLYTRASIDPAGTAAALESQLSSETRTEQDGALALAELSYQAGLARESRFKPPDAALPWYRDAATLSWMALCDQGTSDRALAIEIHNGSLTRLVRAARIEDARKGMTWRDFFVAQGIAFRGSNSYLDPLQIADLRVASDLDVKGMDHMYRCDGLGVPLVVHRVASDSPATSIESTDRYLPRELRTSSTALMTTSGSLTGGQWRKSPPSLVLIDPFATGAVTAGGHTTELARDLSTALASQVAGNRIAVLEWTGLIDSDFQKLGVETGLYMLHPYEPGKIPVVFVHGLSSSPRAWVQTVNELRNNPDLASRYQFWLFMYPSGLPIPTSARSLRQSLVNIRDDLDPNHRERALDNMVLVGHSMGGILSKMMAQNSGDVLWNASITVPPGQLLAPPELKKNIQDLLIFEPLPFVKRVVFIATPHRGSPVADGPIGNFFSAIIRRPTEQAAAIAQVEAMNGPHVMSSELHKRALNSIRNLRTDSPILLALDRIPIDPSVQYHSIIPLVGAVTDTDLVVKYDSSRIDGARTEQVVPGTYFSQQDPTVTHELQKILREHLAATAPSQQR
jgi:pimeloyl-ACP methyl ester carboxylesterase